MNIEDIKNEGLGTIAYSVLYFYPYPFGLQQNEQSIGLVDSEVNMDDLFAPFELAMFDTCSIPSPCNPP